MYIEEELQRYITINWEAGCQGDRRGLNKDGGPGEGCLSYSMEMNPCALKGRFQLTKAVV